uniref:Uncharacterized protein n=1 Tax=Lepeophtheirus salmonis TaxID=72036 RepID=A0A0K2TCQ4_LEPSM
MKKESRVLNCNRHDYFIFVLNFTRIKLLTNKFREVIKVTCKSCTFFDRHFA